MKPHRAREVCRGQTHLHINSSSGVLIISELLLPFPVAHLGVALYNVSCIGLATPVRTVQEMFHAATKLNQS